ncbi:hypothetical protein Tsubulata_036001 [Turnera subulata]|uniref:RING-type domain-containing protein n=1 Tax=Turnera subulata TaxID=218843 RepID=A0A9Q0F9R9_9ROSI|nr:hypothetical protein Tsubulata_036001 [Turnera subulata]
MPSQTKNMFSYNDVELEILQDQSVLPPNQKQPWPKAMFLHLSAARVLNVHVPAAITKTVEGVITKVYAIKEVAFEPLCNSYYLRMDHFPSFVKEAETFIDPLIENMEVTRLQKDRIKTKFSFHLFSLAFDACYYINQRTVAVAAKLKIRKGMAHYPGVELHIRAYKEKLKMSKACVPFSYIQALRMANLEGGGGFMEACSICLERLVDRPHHQVCRLECSHEFHDLCIAQWFIKYCPLCPLCRSSVLSN